MNSESRMWSREVSNAPAANRAPGRGAVNRRKDRHAFVGRGLRSTALTTSLPSRAILLKNGCATESESCQPKLSPPSRSDPLRISRLTTFTFAPNYLRRAHYRPREELPGGRTFARSSRRARSGLFPRLLFTRSLSNSHTLWDFEHTSTRRDSVDRAVKATRHLRPEAGEGHLARADVFLLLSRLRESRAELELAQRTLPGNAQVFTPWARSTGFRAA